MNALRYYGNVKMNRYIKITGRAIAIIAGLFLIYYINWIDFGYFLMEVLSGEKP